MIEFPSAAADRAVLAALEEDAAACDLTTQWSVPDGLVSEATIISRAHGIIAGLQLVDLVMHHIDPSRPSRNQRAFRTPNRRARGHPPTRA
jgi:nicotinate-nucleotide pyrophosphorylase